MTQYYRVFIDKPMKHTKPDYLGVRMRTLTYAMAVFGRTRCKRSHASPTCQAECGNAGYAVTSLSPVYN